MVKSPMAELCGAIARGKYDRNLDIPLREIAAAVTHRREALKKARKKK